jgi:dienelactone hydrolase
LLLTALLASLAAAQNDIETALKHPLLDPNEPLLDVQVYTASKVPMVPAYTTRAQWETYANTLRRRVLDEVIYRGEAKGWREAKTKVEILPPSATGPGYKIRKFRYEVIPGLWAPGVIYEPATMTGKIPVVLNVNGHEGNGTATPYIQARCINLAKKGILAVNPEWLGRGQLRVDGLDHYRMNQIDLTGTSGLALFHLGLKRALDIAISQPNADPTRVAVTGLSGGGWQTIFLASTDTRVALAYPLAGYSSYVTRAQWPELDMGDSEQTPTDLGAVADYAHLTALMAPRVLQIGNNAKDNCCFRADYATGALLQVATPAYSLHDALSRLRYHVNHGDGHNYDQDNREAFYRLLRDFFDPRLDATEIPSDSEVRADAELRPELPADNLDFHKIAMKLAEGMPRHPKPSREELAKIVCYREMHVEAFDRGKAGSGRLWKLRMERAWTVPVTEFEPPSASGTVLLIADTGRATMAERIAKLVADGKRVVAMDPFYFGESKIAKRDYLFSMLVAGIGDRPLGVQASQIAAAARWLERTRGFGPVAVQSAGERTSLSALIAAALEPKSIGSLASEQSLKSLHDVLARDLTARQFPEYFCFGLLARYDIPQMEALVRPRPVSRQ